MRRVLNVRLEDLDFTLQALKANLRTNLIKRLVRTSPSKCEIGDV